MQQFIDPRLVAAKTEVTRLNTQHLTHGEKRIEHQFLRHHTEQTARGRSLALHVMARDPHLTRSRAGQAREHADQRGLARAIGAEKSEKFAVRNIEFDAVHRPVRAVLLEDAIKGNRSSH